MRATLCCVVCCSFFFLSSSCRISSLCEAFFTGRALDRLHVAGRFVPNGQTSISPAARPSPALPNPSAFLTSSRLNLTRSGLWGFLAAWRALFDRFDEDRSGFISYDEYSKALVAFGYNLSAEFVGMMYAIYDRRGANSMSFDLFVQSCISLKRMTDVFKRYDRDRDGVITLTFEEFLTGECSAAPTLAGS